MILVFLQKRNVNKHKKRDFGQMISFNVPPKVGTEEQYISEAIQSRKICGDGQFTKKCNAWLEKKSASLTLFCLLAYFAIFGISTIAFSGVTTDNFMGT